MRRNLAGRPPEFTPEFAKKVWELYVVGNLTRNDVSKALDVKPGSVAYLVRMHDSTLPVDERHYKPKEAA